jgi:UPF0755 protein
MIRRIFILTLATAILVASILAIWLVVFAHTPVTPPSAPFEISIKPGSTLKSAAREISASGLPISAWQFELMARFMGKDRELKAGIYELTGPISPLDLLTKLRLGDAVKSEITFIEGNTFAQMRKILNDHAGLKRDTPGLSDEAILKLIGARESNAEGLFFPDTYVFSGGVSDLTILKQSYQKMQTTLAKEWEKRSRGLPYKTPYESLIMASIIEKETGKDEERPRIAAVFVNRLKRGMKLQTDPTVIYGMGDAFGGNIRRGDLSTDTVYNTYTRTGLPPTPIAMPGLAAIEAALQPAVTDELFFVAKGDGSHQFSRSLEEHNRAVAKYQK